MVLVDACSIMVLTQVLLQLSHARLRLLQTLLTQNRHAAQSAWNTMTKPRNLIDCRQLRSIQESKIERSWNILNVLFVSNFRLIQWKLWRASHALSSPVFFSLDVLGVFCVLVFLVDGVSIYSLFSNVPQFYSFSFCHACNDLEMRTERHWYIWRLWAPRCCAWSFAAQLHSSIRALDTCDFPKSSEFEGGPFLKRGASLGNKTLQALVHHISS